MRNLVPTIRTSADYPVLDHHATASMGCFFGDFQKDLSLIPRQLKVNP
jgi:hypothetical protein